MQLQDFLVEGPHDIANQKVIFLAGGPASGKSTLSQSFIGQYGLKSVDVDRAFEMLAKKLAQTKNADPAEFIKNHSNEPESKLTYFKARNIKNAQRRLYSNQLLGMIIDGTGVNPENINNLKLKLEEIGYETIMIMTVVNIREAIKRNKERARSTNLMYLRTTYQKIFLNMNEYIKIFGNNFYIVDTTENKLGSTYMMKYLAKTFKTVSEKIFQMLNAHIKDRYSIEKIVKKFIASPPKISYEDALKRAENNEI